MLEAAAFAGLTWWAGWREVLHTLAAESPWWFALCAGGQVVAYTGYTLALRRVARADGGVPLDTPVAAGVVGVGFSPLFSANPAGGFSIDLATLRALWVSFDEPEYKARFALALALEYAVLAPMSPSAGCCSSSMSPARPRQTWLSPGS